MKNSEIAQAFSQGIKAENSNKSFYVENVNGVIIAFSYGNHFPIAIKFKDGCLFNSCGYSNTTSRHKSLILATINDLTDEDFLRTEDLKQIVEKVRYSDLTSKAEIIEQKI